MIGGFYDCHGWLHYENHDTNKNITLFSHRKIGFQAFEYAKRERKRRPVKDAKI